MSDNRKYIAIKPTTLSTGVSVGDTTCIPSQIKDRLGNAISAMSSFGTKGFGVISPDTDKEEQFVFTGLSGGTVSGISAVTMQDPYTETSGWQKEHAAGEPIILYTNSPAFYNEFPNVQNDNTFVGTQTFTESAMPRITSAHTYAGGEEEYLATKRYVDGVALSGSPDASTTTKGVSKLSVAPASASNPIAVGDNDPRVPTSGEKALLAAITASATELNILDGYTGTTADLNEMSAIVQATDVTGAELEELTNSSLTTKHKHAPLRQGLSFVVSQGFSGAGSTTKPRSRSEVTVGYADDGDSGYDSIVVGISSTVSSGSRYLTAGTFNIIGGKAILTKYLYDAYDAIGTGSANVGAVLIDGYTFYCSSAAMAKATSGGTVSAITFSGTARYGAMSYDDTGDKVLVLYSSTKIAKFSGSSGTTLTNLNDDVTLAQAVDTTCGFFYDKTNQKYFAIDRTNNYVRKFSSTGTLESSEAYTIDDSYFYGLCVIDGFVHIINVSHIYLGGTGVHDWSVNVDFIPTSLTA